MSEDRQPLVTIARAAWKDLVAQAAGHEREGGGLLIGKPTRYGNFQVLHVLGLTHAEADNDHIRYGTDEVARARLAAYDVYKPLEAVGEWHSHPWPAYNVDAIAPQITDDWDDPMSDVCAMLDGAIELIASTCPDPGYAIEDGEYRIGAKIGECIVRVEAWMRVAQGKIVPCTLKVR